MSDYDREFTAYIETLGEPDPIAIMSQASIVRLKAELRALNRVDDPARNLLEGACQLLGEKDAEIGVLASVVKSYEGRIKELQSYSHGLAKEIDRRNNLDQAGEAYQYLKRLFLHIAPQCCVLPDLLGVCTQLDNAIAGLIIDKDTLRAQLATFRAVAVQNACLTMQDDPDPLANPPPTWVPDPVPAIIDDKPKAPRPHDPFRDFGKDRRRMGPE